jgi:hypothetical protein
MARLAYDPIRLGRLIADVWDNPDLRYQLLTDPRKTLRAAGVQIGKTQRIVVHEDTESTVNIVLPRRPQQFERTDEYLRSVANGLLDGCDRPVPSGGSSWLDRKRDPRTWSAQTALCRDTRGLPRC